MTVKTGKPAVVSWSADEAGEDARVEASAPAAPVVDPSVAVAARLVATYPARADLIAKGFITHGDVITTAVPVKVAGGWGQKVVGRHQKYKLTDGTILTLEA